MTGIHSLRDQAIARLHQKAKIRSYFIAYIFIFLLMVVIWFFSGKGYFWPAWVAFGLLFSLLSMLFRLLRPRKITESQIQAEISRLSD